MKTTRKQIVEQIAAAVMELLLDQIEDAAADLVEEVLDAEDCVWAKLGIKIDAQITQHETDALSLSVLKSLCHTLAMDTLPAAEEWDDVRDKHPRQLMLL